MNLYEKLNRLDDSLVESKRVIKKKKLTEGIADSYEIDGKEVTWPEYFEYNMETNDYFMDEQLFSSFYDKAVELVEKEGFTNVFTEPSTQAGRGGDFFWATKDGVSYRGSYDYEEEQEIFYDAAVNSDSKEEAVDNLAKAYARLIISNLTVDDDYDDDIDEMLTENTLTSYLPPSIDNMLMDMAQMCGKFDYSDVYKFVKAGVDDDTVRRLKNLYRRWNRAAEYNDEEKMCILAKEAAQIIGKYDLTESKVLEGTLDKIKAIIDKTESVKYTTSVTSNGIDVHFTDGSILTAIKNLKEAGFKVYNVGREFDGIVRIVDIPEPTDTQLKMPV